MQAAIANAETLEEVTRLENALNSGVVPSEFVI
jgi:U2 small nuclear ribonucleoprotein A'